MKNDNFIAISYFKESDSICADDFEREDKIAIVNINTIVYITKPISFYLPLSGEPIYKNFSIIRFSDRSCFSIREDEYDRLAVLFLE